MSRMMGVVRSLTAAAAATLFLAMPSQRAQAMSLISPGAAPVTTIATNGLIEVRGGHGGGGHRGGGFHGFHGGGWHGGGVRYGGFHHFGGYHHGGYRFAHFHRRHFFYGSYYPYYYYPHHCRIIWTYYGPRRVCGWRHWHRHYW
ncbi:MAG: hypothetical protein JOZ74_03135 [Bradyrhizobium sp.]|nr:hypothetical protein [Bradyrhizobium sp.]